MFRLHYTAWYNFCGFFISAASTGFIIFIVQADTTPFIHVLQKALVDHIMMSFYEIPHDATSRSKQRRPVIQEHICWEYPNSQAPIKYYYKILAILLLI